MVLKRDISEGELILAMAWHEKQALACGSSTWGVLAPDVAALVEPLYLLWHSGTSIDVTLLSSKAVVSLNNYWLATGSTLHIEAEFPLGVSTTD